MGTIKIDGATVAVAPDNRAEVTKDVGIPYQAIMCPAPLLVYFSPAASTTAINWPANVPLGIESTTRLADTADCFYFGERSV